MSDFDRLHDLLASDDPADHRRAAQLAAGNPELEVALAEHDRLLAMAQTWRGEARAPEHLRHRVLATLEPEVVVADFGARASRSRVWMGLAAAASIVLAVLLFGQLAPEPAVVSVNGRLLVSDALEAANEAEARHAAAIAQLERAAAPILSRASDPGTSGADAALLLAYRDRLSAIDTAIAEVQSYLEHNPGLASARTVLLAAYIDKTRILEEVLGMDEESELG